MLSRLFLPALGLCVLSACDHADLNDKKKDQVQQWSGDVAFADDYFLDDVDCQGEDGAVTVGSSAVHFFQNGVGSDQSFDFSSFGSFAALSGPGFSGTFYDFAQLSACDVDDELSTCGDAKVTSAAKPLKVCRPNDSYPRLSVEGIALTSLASLSRASEYYKKIPGSSPNILAANLLVLPKVEHAFPSGTLIDTDNLAYTPNFGIAPAFIVYPKSRRAVTAGRWVDVNLWEAPWGLAHEFGHHVFRTHTGITSVSDVASKIALGKNLPIGTFKDEVPAIKGLALQGATRTVEASDHWSAVNEGYADLFAFYVYGAHPGLAKDLSCFDQNREVTSDTFTMGVNKQLDAANMASFLSPVSDGGSTCKNPSLQDPHTIGAIVAHGIDALFSAKIGTTEGDEAALKKAEMLLLWANKMGITASSPEAVTIDRLILDALAIVADDGKTLSQAECTSIRKNFPAFADAWLTKSFTCQ